jgi:hypothetical protein
VTDVAAILARATRPRRAVKVCLAGHIVAEMERLDSELVAIDRPAERLNTGGAVRALEKQLDELRTQAEADTIEIVLEAVSRTRWHELVAAHPPRKEPDGTVNPADKMAGINEATFYDAIIRACWVTPEVDEATQTALLDQLTDRQYDQVGSAAWAVNRHEVSIPLSRAGSRTPSSAST